MSATTDWRGNLADQQGNQTRYDEFDFSAIGRWVDQRRDQSDAPSPGDETESWQNHKDSGIGYEPIAERGTAAWGQGRAEDTLQSRQIAEDTPPPWRQHGAVVRDDHVVAQRASAREQWFRVAIICLIVSALGIGTALAWGASSTIGTWAKVATSFLRPKPTTPQPTIADLVQRIAALNSQLGALKQQLNQFNAAQTKLNTAQTKLDAAQAQSAKSAAEQQLKIAALEQLMAKKTQSATRKPHQHETAVKEKRAAAIAQPHPRTKPEPRAAMPLALVPAQH